MSSSQHPVALRLERQVGGATKLLATVMGLPLVDGIFPAIVLAGGLDSVAGILQVGLLVFGGSATVAVILAEMDGTPREQAGTVLAVGTVVIAAAAVEAAFAPTIQSALHPEIFERFAALVILAIAAKTASSRIGEYLPRPGVIVGLGMIASFHPGGFELVTVPDYELVLRATAAAGTGVGFALAVALTAPHLRGAVDIDRFRFGSAVALGVLPLSLLGFAPGRAPLAVLFVTSLLAFDPGTADDATSPDDEQTAATQAMNGDTESASAQAVATDGAGDANDEAAEYDCSDEDGETRVASESDDRNVRELLSDGDEREPWL